MDSGGRLPSVPFPVTYCEFVVVVADFFVEPPSPIRKLLGTQMVIRRLGDPGICGSRELLVPRGALIMFIPRTSSISGELEAIATVTTQDTATMLSTLKRILNGAQGKTPNERKPT